MSALFPFSAVVGHDDLKLALTLAAVDPGIGGVLLRGQKGSAKTTLARALAALLPGDAPFAELPLGATEDRLVGTLDLAAALTTGERRFDPGILASAHGGVLYVDEVNLLPDHLVDALLDVAVSGINRVEREGVAHEHPSRFVLIGSMNPEEGDLRPQLLDRFGLAVEVIASDDPAERAEAVRRRLAFDADPAAFSARWRADEDELRARMAAATPAALPDGLLVAVSSLCASVGAEGLRADLVLCRGAAALAGWEGRPEATAADVRRVAPLALAHRRRRSPFEDPGIAPDELDQALADALNDPTPSDSADETHTPASDPTAESAGSPIVRIEAGRRKGDGTGRRSMVEGPRGRLVGDRRSEGAVGPIAVAATAQAAALRRTTDPDGPHIAPSDLREAVREQRAGNLLVIAVDASGSMGAQARMEAVKGAVLGLLVDAYQRRDRVALVTFRDDRADVALRPTSSVEVAKARLQSLATGGRTPLADGLATALDVALTAGAGDHRPLLVLISDGRATSAPGGLDPLVAARQAADAIARTGIDVVVIDAETGPARLGLTAELAAAMGARHLSLAELTAGALEQTLRSL